MKELVLGNFVDGLYQLVNTSTPFPALSVTSTSSMSLWHKSLGHIPHSVIFKIDGSFVSGSNCSEHSTVLIVVS